MATVAACDGEEESSVSEVAGQVAGCGGAAAAIVELCGTPTP